MNKEVEIGNTGAAMNTRRVIAEGYDRLGDEFAEWNGTRPSEGHDWFLGEVLSRLHPGTTVLELGCGPGTDAEALSDSRRYVGVDLSSRQLVIAKMRVPAASLLVADITSQTFRRATFDAVVAFNVFNHVPMGDVKPAFEAAFECLRPGGHMMLAALPTTEADDRVEEWLGVPMFFAGVKDGMYDDTLRRVGFQIEVSEIRFSTQEWWGRSDPRWIIATRPG
jgi:cyclopropane fatty-acyl-phospholipid synthase-like methyltransferase